MNKPYKIARRSALKEYDSKWKHIFRKERGAPEIMIMNIILYL